MKDKIFITLLIFVIICISGCSSNEVQETNIISAETSSVLSTESTDTVSHEDSETEESNVETDSAFTSEKTVSTVSSKSEPKRNKITVVSSEPQPESKPESKVESQKEGKEIHIGDKITTDFGEMSIESYKISKTLDYTITNFEGVTVPVALDADAGKTFLIFTGIYKNTSGDKYSPFISSDDAIINDEYNYNFLFLASDNIGLGSAGVLDPLESNRYYGCLEVPDETINVLKKCELSFTFSGGEGHNYHSEKYRLIITR